MPARREAQLRGGAGGRELEVSHHHHELIAAVRGAIERKAPWEDRRAILVEFRDKGMTAAQAAAALTAMAKAAGEGELQDHIHDLLDIATGWCGSSSLVWTGEEIAAARKPTE
jgi:hypothetical protein